MNVYVDICRVDIKVYEIRNLLSRWDKMFIRIGYSFMEIRMAHISAIHKEELARAFLSCSFRFADETVNLHHRSVNIKRQKVLVQLLAEHTHYALPQLYSRQIQDFGSVMVECE